LFLFIDQSKLAFSSILILNRTTMTEQNALDVLCIQS